MLGKKGVVEGRADVFFVVAVSELKAEASENGRMPSNITTNLKLFR